MGMFDYIDVHEKYLVDDEPTTGWQTKDLECELDLFCLDSSGNLMKMSELGNGWGHNNCNRLEDYTGNLNFYTYLPTSGPLIDDWREYKATFLNGKLTNIERLYEQ